jgi:hypothetical protein
MSQEVPSNFRTLIADLCRDLTITFPDYSYFWAKWTEPDVSDDEIQILFNHCVKVYPERFFDILYQNDDMFGSDSLVNTDFLPRVSFRFLFNCEDVTENTKKAMWKYLQLILFSIIGGVKDKATFGETMNIFEGINESDLQEKLKETMGGITDFFSNMERPNHDENEQERGQDESAGQSTHEHFKSMFEGMNNGMPNMENIQDHLKSLFDGKIGKLAKEMAEEISDEFSDLVGEDMNDAKNTQDVLKKLMKNPKKIMDLMKKVSGKLDSKMKSGEISRDELMREAGDLLGKMKGMGGQEDFNEMFKKMAASMGGLGKEMRMDTNAMERMTKQASTREKLLSKIGQKKKMQEDELLRKQQEIRQRQEAQQKLEASYSLLQKDSPTNLVFRLEGEEAQEKSFVHPDLLKELETEKTPAAKSSGKKKKGKKGK